MRAPRTGGLLWPLALYALGAAFIAWHVRLLEKPEVPSDRLLQYAALAALPALVAVWRGRRVERTWLLGALAGLVLAVGLVTGHWPLRPHLLGDTGYFALAAGEFWNGGYQWTQVVLPFDPDRYPDLQTAITLVVFVLLSALAAALLVWRAPLVALLVVFVPFMAVSTVFVLDDRSLRAGLMLGLALVYVAALRAGRPRPERPGRGAMAGATVVAAALLAVSLPGVAKGAFFDWRNWRAATIEGESVSYVWDHSYGALVRPDEPIDVLEVRSDVDSYWRATVLERFNGEFWEAIPPTGQPRRTARIEIPRSQLSPWARDDKRKTFTASFTNVGLDEPSIITGGQPTEVRGIPVEAGAVIVSDDGTLPTERSTPVRTAWEVDAVALEASPDELTAAPSPPSLPRNDPLRRQLAVTISDVDVEFPPFAAEDRELEVQSTLAREFTDPRLVDWTRVYARIREVTKGAATPYEATLALERWFQTEFRYDETADFSQAPNGPLPAFMLGETLDVRAGHCQMFSGAMATSLRMLGIPARVAEGFIPGTEDESGIKRITDRDAHAWVEVWFQGIGWMPFEPTPTRRLPGDAPSTTSPNFGDRLDSATGSAALRERFGTGFQLDRLGPDGANRGPAGAGTGGVAPVVDESWRPGRWTWTLLAVLGLLAVVPLAKRLRGARAYVARDPHAIAAAVRADLVSFVVDQQPRNGHATLTPDELSRLLRRDFAVDADAWVRDQTRARYGPEGGEALAAARQARREARQVKRQLRRSLTRGDRVWGALRVRSLLP